MTAMIAASFRSRANLRTPAFSTSKIIESCFPDTVVTGRHLPEGVQELVTVTPTGPLILYQRKLPILEQRFAIAHALGHLIYDFRDGRSLAPLFDPAVESRADDFALELLTPLEHIRKCAPAMPEGDDSLDREEFLDQVDEMASRFQAPPWAIRRQIQRLKR